jgi:hypothetical protein
MICSLIGKGFPPQCGFWKMDETGWEIDEMSWTFYFLLLRHYDNYHEVENFFLL